MGNVIVWEEKLAKKKKSDLILKRIKRRTCYSEGSNVRWKILGLFDENSRK